VAWAEPGDQFGFALSAWNFGRAAHADLAIGISLRGCAQCVGNNLDDARAVQLVYGSATGLTATGQSAVATQNNLPGSTPGDQFGRAVY
jgi:hypothetical protein